MGHIVNIFDNSKYFEKNDNKILLSQNLINDINNDIVDIISSLDSIHNMISYEEGKNSYNSMVIRDSISDLEEYMEEITNLDFSLYDNLLYKLHIMKYISHNDFLKRFNTIFDKQNMDEVDISYMNNLVDLYIGFMQSTLVSIHLDQDLDDDNINIIKSYIKDECNNLYVNSKREVFSRYLYSLVYEQFGENNLSNLEGEFIDSLIIDTIDTFINYHYVDIRKYFVDILKYITDDNLFKQEIIDLNKENRGLINKEIKERKLYYSTLENIRINYNFFLNDVVSLENREEIFDGFLEIENKVKKENDFSLNNFVNHSMKTLNAKIINLITSVVDDNRNLYSLVLEYLNDDIEINRVIRFINSLKECILNNNQEFNFDSEWDNAKSKVIFDKLYDVIRREIFRQEDKEFYLDIEYRKKLDDMMMYISVNPNYINYFDNNSKLIPDFNIALNLLKGGMVLENKARELGLDEVLYDIENLDYKDYSYTSDYLVSLSDMINESNVTEKYCDMKKELSKKRKKNR